MMNMENKSKRVKINFESINKGKYSIIPPKDIADANERIKNHMKVFLKMKKYQKNIVRDEFNMYEWELIKREKYLGSNILEAMETHALQFANFLKEHFFIEGDGDNLFWLDADSNKYYTTELAYREFLLQKQLKK